MHYRHRHSTRFGRTNSSIANTSVEDQNIENVFLDNIRFGETAAIQETAKDPTKSLQLSQNWELVRKCAKDVAATSENTDLLK
jgi:hypothetical protein